MKSKLNTNIEKTINYLLEKGYTDIKLIYVQKEKHIDTLTKNIIKHNTIVEDGMSISFYFNKEQYFIALNNFNSFHNIKKNIQSIINSRKKINLKKKFKLKEDIFKIESSKFDSFNIKEYQNQLLKFITEYNNLINITIPLLSERKRTFVISPNVKNIYKEEFHYKIDIIMNSIINNVNRFNYFSEGCTSNLNDLKKINIYTELKKLYNVILKMKSIDSINQKSTVVMSNGIGGILIHEACGHSLESREIIKNTSVFSGIKDVNNSNINIIDNPTLNKKFGSFEIDDEGNKATNQILIKNGKIENYLCDNNGVRYLKDKNSGSGRRESYYNIFSSRMSNTYIENGKYSFDEIINSIKDGFYVKNILGGVVDTISGNFSFNCIETYRILDGKIDYSVCYDNLTIIGNTLDILKNIDMIGNDLKLNCGICGSTSGFIYTTVGEPTIKIKNLFMVS